MAKPLPLTAYGPVTPISPAVRVTGVLPGAEVTILDNGNPIGHQTAANPGELWVKITSQPLLNHRITAVQNNADGSSDPSSQTILVVDVPDPLPVPVIFSDLNTCVTDILAGALVTGAKVITLLGGQPFGSIVASQPTSWVGIDPVKGISPGSRVEIHQEATIGSVTRVSKPVLSLPIPAFTKLTHLLPAPVLGPLITCDMSRSFLQVVPGAQLTIVNEGQSESWINPASAYQGYGAPPLKTGKAIVSQNMPRCDHRGESATLPVEPPGAPLPPTVTQELCPQVLRLTVSNLAPGGILHVYRRVIHSSSSWSQALIGDLGIGYTTQPVDLPPGLSLSDPAGTVVIALSQSRCTGEGPTTVVKVATASGPFDPPRIVEPVFDCARAIPVTGAHVGSMVQAFDKKTGLEISDPFGVAQPDFPITTWFPLVAGQVVFVRQWGCNADGDSKFPTVQSLPQPLPNPKIVEPVRPHAPWVKVTGVVPGARLHLLVNNQLRPGSIDVLSDSGVIPVIGQPFAENDRVFVVQTLCDRSSNIEGPGVTVKRGTMKVSVVPAQVTRGTIVNVVVSAVDADTGTPVAAQVLLNAKNVGTTGAPFSYSPKIGDSNPIGLVQEPVAYSDAAFSITLVEPNWTLFVQAGPIPAFLGAIQIDLDEITWSVTPDWNSSLSKTLTVKPSSPSANSSTPLPQPTGSVKTVTVSIAGKASTLGGNLNGFIIPPQSFVIGSDARKVAFHGPNQRIGWLLQVGYITDQTSAIVFNVIPTFAGINDVP